MPTRRTPLGTIICRTACALLTACTACSRFGFGLAADDGGAARQADGLSGDDGASDWRFALPSRCGRPLWPSGATIDVSPADVDRLDAILDAAPAGAQVLLGDGDYPVGRPLIIDQPGIVLRSASGQRDAVTIRGGDGVVALLSLLAANVVVADLTLQDSLNDGLLVAGETGDDATGVVLYNLRSVDHLFAHLRVRSTDTSIADGGLLACSRFEQSDAFRSREAAVCSEGRGAQFDGARGWRVEDNEFVDFYCSGQRSRGPAVGADAGARDLIVRRNRFFNAFQAIRMGFSDAPGSSFRSYSDAVCGSGYVSCFGGFVCNNLIFADQRNIDSGILIWNACGVSVLYNTVYTRDQAQQFSAIEWRYPNSDPVVVNNLANFRFVARSGAVADERNNELGAIDGWFTDGPGGDLHLSAAAAGALDQGSTLNESACQTDIDGETRGVAPDLGGDER